jgi:dihydroorotase
MSALGVPNRFVLRGARVIDPESGIDGPRDALIDRGILKGMEPSLPGGVDAVDVPAKGKILAPGLQDMHVHFREPGDEDAETIATGALAAACGGFTHVLTMPNTKPPVDQKGVVELILQRAAEACGTIIRPCAAITKGLEGRELTEMIELREAGALAVSDDGHPVESAEMMRRGMEYARGAGLLLISHCEDRKLAGSGVMNEGYWSTSLGLRGIPSEAETLAIARDLGLARLTGCNLHVAHVSTEGGVELIRRAKAEGLPVTAETAPHYLALTDESLRSYDARFKMNPPLRTQEDRTALKEGLRDGTIDVIATDHAPHPSERKEVEIDAAPFGVIGLESSLSICIRELIDERCLDWPGLIHAMSSRVAGILGWGGGKLVVGKPADLTLIDPDAPWTVRAEQFASLSSNCPFEGQAVRGKVLLTMANGRITYAATGLLG